MYDGKGTGNNLINVETGQIGHFNYHKFLKSGLHYLKSYGVVAPNRYHIFKDRRLNYLMLAKVACSAILTTIGKSYGIPAAGIFSDPRWNVRWGKLEDSFREYDTFAFVRNPFDRIVSCYRDKIIHKNDHHRYLYAGHFFDLPANISFTELVQRISAIPDRLADRHFKSQSSSLYENGKPLANQIGRFENLREDWRKLACKYHFDPDLVHYNDSKTKEGALSDFRAYYDEGLVELVYQRYKHDVELLGYRQAYDELLDYVRTGHHENRLIHASK
ncbi:MAG: sulfotransferase family 2 domain-containing protein [bacterium]